MAKRKANRKILYAFYAVMLALTAWAAIWQYNFYKSGHPPLPSPAPFSEAEIINFVRHDLGKTIAVEPGASRETHMQIAAPYITKQGNTMLVDDLEKFGWFDGETVTYVDFTKPVEVIETSYFEGLWLWIAEAPISVDVVKGESRETQNFYAYAFVQFKEGADTDPSFFSVRLRTEPLKPVDFSGIRF